MSNHYEDKHAHVGTHLRKRHIMVNNFLGGLAWGLGSVIGATVVVAVIGIILSALGFFDSIQAFLDYIQGLNPNNHLPSTK